MLFASFFQGITEFLFGVSVMVFFAFSSWYAVCGKKNKGLYEVFFGFLIYLTASAFDAQYQFFIFYGVSPEILSFLRLLGSVGASVLFLMGSSEILLQKKLSMTIIFVFISIGIVLSFYTVFIANSAEMKIIIDSILPLVGLIYLFLSLVSKQNLKKHLGHVFGALSVFGMIEQIGLYLFLGVNYSFVFTLVLMLMLTASYFMMASETTQEEKILLENKLGEINSDMNSIIKSSPFPIIISKLTDDTVMFANQNALKLFELNLAELHRYHFKDFFVDADNRKLLLEKLEHFKEIQDFEILVKTSIGETPFWLMVSANIINYQGAMALYCAFQDITARKQREKALQNQADRDPLTAIYNRRYFEKTVTEKIMLAHRNKQDFAVLMVDADYFKNINDKYGHKTGDKVLIELAHTLERSLRPEDVVARYGGEEFVVFLNQVTADIALMVAERLRDAVSHTVVYSEQGEPLTWTVSIGVAPCGISDSVGLMIKMADDAMYLAKENGRNRVEVYRPEVFKTFENKSVFKEQIHPVLAKEDEQEISLLDGIEANRMIED